MSSGRATTVQAPGWTTKRRFIAVLLLIAAAGAGIRVAYVLTTTHHQAQLYGDQLGYVAVAKTIAQGHGFRDPFITSHHAPDANHPPLTSLLATPGWLLFPHDESSAVLFDRLTMALVGAGTVIAIGAAARRAATNVEVDPDSGIARRVGWIAAGLAAIHPNLWIHDGVIMSEGVGALAVALVIWAAIRALDRPTAWRVAVLGAMVGVSALARSETILLAPLLIIPVAFTRRGNWADRTRFAAIPWLIAGGLGLMVVIGPWVVPNLVRFQNPVLLSTNDGDTLLGANCNEAYHGTTKGLWIQSCVAADALRDPADQSVNSARFRSAAEHYVRHHLSEVPAVVLIREARTWSVWSPHQEVYLNTGEGDAHWVSWASIISTWVTIPVGALGWLALRRRDRPVWPFVAQVVLVAFTAAAFYGLARFRISADVAFVIGCGVALEVVIRRVLRLHDDPPPVLAIANTWGPSQAPIVGT